MSEWGPWMGAFGTAWLVFILVEALGEALLKRRQNDTPPIADRIS